MLSLRFTHLCCWFFPWILSWQLLALERKFLVWKEPKPAFHILLSICCWLSFLCVFRPPLPSSVQCCCPRLGLVFWTVGIGQWGDLPRDWREGGLSIYLFLDFLLETVSCCNAAILLQGPQSTQLSFLRILKTSLPVVGSLYQLVAIAPLLLTLVPELSVLVPPSITQNFVISLFVNKVLS